MILGLKEITHERAARGRKHSIRKSPGFQGRRNFKDLLTWGRSQLWLQAQLLTFAIDLGTTVWLRIIFNSNYGVWGGVDLSRGVDLSGGFWSEWGVLIWVKSLDLCVGGEGCWSPWGDVASAQKKLRQEMRTAFWPLFLDPPSPNPSSFHLPHFKTMLMASFLVTLPLAPPSQYNTWERARDGKNRATHCWSISGTRGCA